MLKIKQEPTQEAVKESLEEFGRKLQKCEDFSFLHTSLVEVVQHLTAAESVRLLLPGEGALSDPEGKTDLPLENGKGLVRMAIDQQSALFTNDVLRDDRYDAASDNPGDYPLKSLLVYPFFHSDQRLTAVLWAAIPLKDLNQFVSRDPERLHSIVEPLNRCLDRLQEARTTTSVIAAESESDVKDDIGVSEAPALIDAIKSWLSGLKKQ